MKIFKTIHQKKQYWLVFDDDNEVVGKYETWKEAKEYINKLNK